MLAALFYLLISFQVPTTEAIRIAQYINQYSIEYNIDPLIVLAIAKHESEFCNEVYNSKTFDYGIMQVHCPTRKYANWCNDKRKLRTLKFNIKTGIYILYRYKRQYKKGNNNQWLRHYNWYSKNYRKKILRIRKDMIRRLNVFGRNYR